MEDDQVIPDHRPDEGPGRFAGAEGCRRKSKSGVTKIYRAWLGKQGSPEDGRARLGRVSAGGRFAAIGNTFLLKKPTLLQVQCSRSDFGYRRARNAKGNKVVDFTTAAFDEKLGDLLASAACFAMWNYVCKGLGVVRATIGLYLTPIVGVI